MNEFASHHVQIEFVVGSHPYSEGFSSGYLVFLPPQKLLWVKKLQYILIYIVLNQ